MMHILNIFLIVGQISYLEVEVETLTEQLHNRDVHVEDQNGTVTVDDLDHIQKVNRELEQQLDDKNRVSCCCAGLLEPSRGRLETAHSAPPNFSFTGYISIRHTHHCF